MAEVRVARQEDKTEFYRLWKICFGDSDAFCDWFFENRFSPEHSVVLEAEGEIVSCMQAFLYTIQIRGKEILGAMLCGVSTHPDHRKKGYMGKIFSYEMNHLRKMGYVVAPHTPAVLPSYFSFGHFPVADAVYLRSNVIPSLKKSDNVCNIRESRFTELYPLYKKLTETYSGIIKRTEADFQRKAADYAADGGKAIAYIKNDEVKAYAFYYTTETEVVCVEALAEDGYWEELINGLCFEGEGLKLKVKLPPEIDISLPYTSSERKQKGVMGLCNVQELLKQLSLPIPYGFQVKDSVVEENNGIFDFNGEAYDGSPVFEISAGHLLQVLVGYHTLEELRDDIRIADEVKFKEINELLPKQDCYIIDEY